MKEQSLSNHRILRVVSPHRLYQVDIPWTMELTMFAMLFLMVSYMLISENIISSIAPYDYLLRIPFYIAIFSTIFIAYNKFKWINSVTQQPGTIDPAYLITDKPTSNTPQPNRYICYGTEKELRDLDIGPDDLNRNTTMVRRVNKPCYNKLYIYLAILSFGIPYLLLLFYNSLWARLFSIGTLVLTSIVVYAPLFTVHYRITLGRLEVLKNSLFRGHPRIQKTIDLRNAKITCRFDRRIIIFENDQGCEKIKLAGLFAPHAFAQAVFQAALSDD